jgi:hypothetical protein
MSERDKLVAAKERAYEQRQQALRSGDVDSAVKATAAEADATDAIRECEKCMSMRDLVIARITELWSMGFDEFPCWAVEGLSRQYSDTLGEFFVYRHLSYPVHRSTDIRPLLKQLSNVELFACLDGQLCQHYR